MAKLVEREARGLHLLVERGADQGGALAVVDRLIVLAFRRLGGREDRLGQALGLAQAGGQPEAADGAALLVGAPAAADEITAHDAFDGQRLQLLYRHAAKLEVAGESVFRGEQAGLIGQEVVGDELPHLREPPQTDLREHDALAGDAVGQDHIEGRQAVGGGDQQRIAQVEDFAHLAGGELGEGETCNLRDGRGRNGGGDFGESHGRCSGSNEGRGKK